jgi:hypothetical protein
MHYADNNISLETEGKANTDYLKAFNGPAHTVHILNKILSDDTELKSSSFWKYCQVNLLPYNTNEMELNGTHELLM